MRVRTRFFTKSVIRGLEMSIRFLNKKALIREDSQLWKSVFTVHALHHWQTQQFVKPSLGSASGDSGSSGGKVQHHCGDSWKPSERLEGVYYHQGRTREGESHRRGPEEALPVSKSSVSYPWMNGCDVPQCTFSSMFWSFPGWRLWSRQGFGWWMQPCKYHTTH